MTDGRPTIIKQFDVKEEIKASNARRSSKGLAPITLDALHKNQTHEMATHLKHDSAHRLLPALRANARTSHPSMIGRNER